MKEYLGNASSLRICIDDRYISRKTFTMTQWAIDRHSCQILKTPGVQVSEGLTKVVQVKLFLNIYLPFGIR
jgi:hypothetical protein